VIEKLTNAGLGSRPEDALAGFYQFEESYRKHLLIFAKELTSSCYVSLAVEQQIHTSN